MLQVSCVTDLDAQGMDLLKLLRQYSDVMLLEAKAPWIAYQKQIAKLHQLGIVNLSLTLLGSNQLPLEQVQHKIRSLQAQIRESKKRVSACACVCIYSF